MIIDGGVAHYLLSEEFERVSCDKSAYRTTVDFPILYDAGADMSGHLVLMPEHERPHKRLRLDGSICLCMSDASAAAVRAVDVPAICVGDDVTFPHLYNFLQRVYVRFENLDARMRALVETRAGVQELLSTCAQATNSSFELIDDQYRHVCKAAPKQSASPNSSQDLPYPSMLEESSIDMFMASHSYRHMRSNKNVFAVPSSNDLLMKNLFFGGDLVGVVMSRHDGTTLGARYVRFVLQYLSSYVAEMYERIGSFGVEQHGANRLRAALSQQLSVGASAQAEIKTLLRENGHAPESTYVVLRIEREFTHEMTSEYEQVKRRFELTWPLAYCFTADNALYLFSDIGSDTLPAGRDFSREILIAARDNLSKVGMSRNFTSLDYLDAARAQATAALEQGRVSDPTYWFYRFDDYALSWLVEHGRRNTPVLYVAHSAVTALLHYDAEHGTDLLGTLETFIRCRFNATRASNNLYVARSTLLNRLERITSLTGVDFDDFEDLAYLTLSLLLVCKDRQVDAMAGTAEQSS